LLTLTLSLSPFRRRHFTPCFFSLFHDAFIAMPFSDTLFFALLFSPFRFRQRFAAATFSLCFRHTFSPCRRAHAIIFTPPLRLLISPPFFLSMPRYFAERHADYFFASLLFISLPPRHHFSQKKAASSMKPDDPLRQHAMRYSQRSIFVPCEAMPPPAVHCRHSPRTPSAAEYAQIDCHGREQEQHSRVQRRFMAIVRHRQA
jgi:hypothetical protein